jgi:hypothetical protein
VYEFQHVRDCLTTWFNLIEVFFCTRINYPTFRTVDKHSILFGIDTMPPSFNVVMNNKLSVFMVENFGQENCNFIWILDVLSFTPGIYLINYEIFSSKFIEVFNKCVIW